MRNLLKLKAISLLIICMLMSGCFKNEDQSKLRKIADTSDRVADYSLAAAKTVDILVTDKILDPIQDADKIRRAIQIIREVNNGNKLINGGVKDILASGTANLAQVTSLVAQLDLIEKSLDRFNAVFITTESNEKLRVIMASFYASTKVAITTIRILYMEIQEGQTSGSK